MLNRLSIKIALSFFSIILITLSAAGLLFFVAVGRPLAQNIHTLLRSHTHYLAHLVQSAETTDRLRPQFDEVFGRFTEHYGFEVALFDADFQPVAASTSLKDRPVEITGAMRAHMDREAIFIQSSHFNKPLVYMLPLTLESGTRRYLYITRTFSAAPDPALFFGGLAILGLLLTAAAYPLSGHITRPLVRLAQNFEKIAAGRFESVPESHRKDEIGILLRGFRRMSQSVHHLIQTRQQLLADISHELCSPMARIRIGTELIKPALMDEKSRRYLKSIESDIGSMDHLIERLSAFSRMQLPGFAIRQDPISPRELVETIGDLYRAAAAVRRIRIEPNACSRLPDVYGDFECLKQVFCNLMDNALRYTDSGQAIRLGAEWGEAGVCFFVEDPGPGVAEKEADAIFEPFYRVDSSRNRETGGAGLGLPLCRKIMELHGGDLVYTRSENRTRMLFHVRRQP